MENQILYLDVGHTVTSARAVTVSKGGFASMGYGVSLSPPVTSGDLTAAIPQALSNMKDKMEGAAYDPDRIAVTVSAGGEPRTVCAGVVRGISGESAKRAALLAGATVSDLISVDDGRQNFERVSDLRRQEIAMVVMAGGVDEEILKSGSHQILNIAKVLADGLPRKRGNRGRVPVIYAASADGREEVARILGDTADIIWADNVRPTLEVEKLESARSAVVGAFTEAIGHDSRFPGLGRFGSPEALPSGYTIGISVEEYHKRTGQNVLVISLDHDVVQVFSGIRGIYTRTVTPVQRVQEKNVRRHLPAQRLQQSLEDMLGNWKMRPGTLPGTWDELAIYLAIYKEAVREAVADHRASSIELRGVHRQRLISETFQVSVSGGDTLVRMEKIGKVVFAGPLSRILSPAALISLAMDGADPAGITEVLLDADDALAVAGTLGRMGVEASFEEMLRPIGLLVSPGKNEERVNPNRASMGAPEPLNVLPVESDEITVVSVEDSKPLTIAMDPTNNKVDFGEGEGHKVRREIKPGFSSIYLDGRGRRYRPDVAARDRDLQKWYRALKVFPDDVISGWAGGR